MSTIKGVLLAGALLSFTHASLAAPAKKQWDQMVLVNGVSAYFERSSVVPVSADHVQASFVMLLDTPQIVDKKPLSFFSFTYTFDCTSEGKSDLISMSAGVPSDARSIVVIPKEQLSNWNKIPSDFDKARWSLACQKSPAVTKPITATLVKLERLNKKRPKAPHSKSAVWTVARHSGKHFDLFNISALKKDGELYRVEYLNMQKTDTDQYTIYKGMLDCSNKKVMLQSMNAYSVTQSQQIGLVRTDVFANQNDWSVDFNIAPKRFVDTMLNVCTSRPAKPTFEQTWTGTPKQVVETYQQWSTNLPSPDAASALRKMMDDSKEFVPYQFLQE